MAENPNYEKDSDHFEVGFIIVVICLSRFVYISKGELVVFNENHGMIEHHYYINIRVNSVEKFPFQSSDKIDVQKHLYTKRAQICKH